MDGWSAVSTAAIRAASLFRAAHLHPSPHLPTHGFMDRPEPWVLRLLLSRSQWKEFKGIISPNMSAFQLQPHPHAKGTSV